mgnify:CR=1 FL=1
MKLTKSGPLTDREIDWLEEILMKYGMDDSVLCFSELDGLLTRALELSEYHAKKERCATHNAANATQKKGIGFATFLHGAGFTGSGERFLESVVGIEATATGNVRILVASTEIGQGTNTILSQIAADVLQLDYEMIELAQPDTANVPNSGPTVASRTCMIVGKLVESAALGLQKTLMQSGLLGETYSVYDWRNACARYIAEHGTLKSFSKYEAPPNIFWDDETYQGDAYGAYAWAVYVAEVTVDLVTYETRVDDFVALQEVGKVINPVLAAGQIEGGVAQAIGYALYENVVWDKGAMRNNQMTNYIMPTSEDLPPIRVYFEENPYAYGPSGAKAYKYRYQLQLQGLRRCGADRESEYQVTPRALEAYQIGDPHCWA